MSHPAATAALLLSDLNAIFCGGLQLDAPLSLSKQTAATTATNKQEERTSELFERNPEAEAALNSVLEWMGFLRSLAGQ